MTGLLAEDLDARIQSLVMQMVGLIVGLGFRVQDLVLGGSGFDTLMRPIGYSSVGNPS